MPEEERPTERLDFVRERQPFKVEIVSVSHLQDVLGAGERIDPFIVCFIPGTKISECSTAIFENEPNPYWGVEKEIRGHKKGDALEFAVYNAHEKVKKEAEDTDVLKTHKGRVVGRCNIVAHDHQDVVSLELGLSGASHRPTRPCRMHINVDFSDEKKAALQELEELKVQKASLQRELDDEREIEASFLEKAVARERREKAIVDSRAKSSVPENMALKLDGMQQQFVPMARNEVQRCKCCRKETVESCSHCRLPTCSNHSKRCFVCNTAFCLDCAHNGGHMKRVGGAYRCDRCNVCFGKAGKLGAKRFPASSSDRY